MTNTTAYETTYWTGKGYFQATVETLHNLIEEKFYFDTRWMPKGTKGYENYHLERLRKAKNAYYRFYNDGVAGQAFRGAFGFSAGDFRYLGTHEYNPAIYAELEKVMNTLVQNAAEEQNVSLRGPNGRFVKKL